MSILKPKRNLYGVQLITYPDSLAGDLTGLRRTIDTHFDGLFTGIHILPFYPSSGDRGFAPLTYFDVEPAFGDWSHVKALGESHDLLADIMVNHISAKSAYFQDYLQKGEASAYADYFVPLTKIWADGQPVQADIDQMFLRRQTPYSTYQGANADVTVWTTFGKEEPSQQVDLDTNAPAVRQFFAECFEHFAKQGINMVRLDAVGYVVKKLGTSCFFVEPEIDTFLHWIADLAKQHDILLLPEVHSHYSIQYKLSKMGFWIYDFILPFRILEALVTKQAHMLADYLITRPTNQFTMLDCHDGIPVKPDLDDLITVAQARVVSEYCQSNGGNFSLIVSDEHKGEDGFDVHQIRGTFYSLLGCDDNAYIAARTLQLFTPGIPQVYYVGLLAGEHDEAAVARTGEGREINRHNFTELEIEQAMSKAVVQRLHKLVHFRNSHAHLFDPTVRAFSVTHTDTTLTLEWAGGGEKVTATIDLVANTSTIQTNNQTWEV